MWEFVATVALINLGGLLLWHKLSTANDRADRDLERLWFNNEDR